MTKSTQLTSSPKMWDYYVSAITTKFAAFKGVATRKEYWSFVLFYGLLCLPFALLESISIDLAWLTSVYEIIFFIPVVAVLARRMHDVGWSAWLMLTIVAPSIAVFLPTNKNSKYAKEESQPLTKGKKITIAVILSLLSVGTIADTIYTNKQINNALSGLERLGKQLESVGDQLEKIGDGMAQSSDRNGEFSEIFTADDSEDLILQGLRQGYVKSCMLGCTDRPDKEEPCRCVCQSLALTMSLQDFQYLANYGEAEWIKLDSARNRLQNALYKCGN